jgi:cardiolipin synthase
MNISDKYITANSELGIWYDVHLGIKGPAVQSLQQVFSKDFFLASNSEMLHQPKYFPAVANQGKSIVQVVSSGPDSDFAAVMQQYLMLITQAEKSIYIANSYFIPGVVILEAIKLAALSGIDVKLLIPDKSDNRFVKYSMFSYFDEMLASGIKIYLYKSTFLHSKVIIVDDEIASVGTGNFDNRSFEQNFEVNTLIYDKDVANAMKNHFLADCDISTLLNTEVFSKRSLIRKMVEGVARIFSPLL